jgi:hypothetical protein
MHTRQEDALVKGLQPRGAAHDDEDLLHVRALHCQVIALVVHSQPRLA